MITEDLTVPSGTDARTLHQKCIDLIPGRELGYIFKRNRLKKDVIAGLVGERGGGKDAGGSTIALVDYMMDGIPVFSNMAISCDIAVSNECARKYGLDCGGVAHYHSLPLDMKRLLRFDPLFEKSCIYVSEINVELSEARRSQTNTNLFSNRLAQEMRHLQSAFWFTTISETFVDNRLRYEFTDAWIKTEDTAYTRDNILRGKPEGIDFKWTTFLMSRCFTGETYYDTHQPFDERYFHFMPWHGIFSTHEYQGEGMLKYGVDFRNLDNEDVRVEGMSVKQSPVVLKHENEWAWFDKVYHEIVDSIPEEEYLVPCERFWTHPEVLRHRLSQKTVGEELRDIYNVTYDRKTKDKVTTSYYKLPDRSVFIK